MVLYVIVKGQVPEPVPVQSYERWWEGQRQGGVRARKNFERWRETREAEKEK